MVGLTKVAALEGAPHGIRVNAVCPGPIETAFIASVAREWGSGDIDKGRAEMSESVPLRRLGTPTVVVVPPGHRMAGDGKGNVVIVTSPRPQMPASDERK